MTVANLIKCILYNSSLCL